MNLFENQNEIEQEQISPSVLMGELAKKDNGSKFRRRLQSH